MSDAAPEAQDGPIRRVSNIELFLDLVFVFAVTQLTGLVSHPHGAAGYARALLVFLTLMWMYEGFAWLTSNLRVRTDADHWLLGAAMAGFLVMSLAVPTVFGAGGPAYGAGLVAVTLVHAAMFERAPTGRGAILSILPFNLASALLVLAAAFAPEPWQWASWLLAALLPHAVSALRREARFAVSPEHFAERHGLLILIALGEAVVGIGGGARGLPLALPLLSYAVLGLYLGLCVWGSYFNGDDERARRAMEAAPPTRRNRMALLGFGYAHFAMLFGIILAAAGLEEGVRGPLSPAPTTAAWNLAAGLALYLAGDVAYRRTMGIDGNGVRLGVAAAVLPAALLGTGVGALAQLATSGLLLTGVWVTDNREDGDEPEPAA